MKIINVVQGSPEWKLARAGRVTASCVDKVLSRAKDRKSEGATRANYKAQLIAEIISGAPQESDYTNDWMEDGTENEPFARASYEIKMGELVTQVGMVIHPRLERFSASPDGLVGDKGMVQIKCPKPANHIAYRVAGRVPAKYECQLYAEMEVCERQWSDFVSYCPAFPPPVNLFVVRLEKNGLEQQRICAEVVQFNREIDELIEKLTGESVEKYLARFNLEPACL